MVFWGAQIITKISFEHEGKFLGCFSTSLIINYFCSLSFVIDALCPLISAILLSVELLTTIRLIAGR